MSAIEWTDETWNPIRGCSRVSEGCRNCYAERMAARFSGYREIGGGTFVDEPFRGFASMTKSGPRWTGRVELIPEKLDEPLHWRKPRRLFVNSMSDLFHEKLYEDVRGRPIGRIFDVMVRAHWHTFQVLTKRAKNLYEWSKGVAYYPKGDRSQRPKPGWPPNVWLGVSVEDQQTADERIPLLRQTPAAVRFVSVEPMLEQVDLCLSPGMEVSAPDGARRGVHWVIVGGESGPGARPCDMGWIRSIARQCRHAGVACFVKQLGARTTGDRKTRPTPNDPGARAFLPRWKHPKGGDPSEWPEDLRLREWPR